VMATLAAGRRGASARRSHEALVVIALAVLGPADARLVVVHADHRAHLRAPPRFGSGPRALHHRGQHLGCTSATPRAAPRLHLSYTSAAPRLHLGCTSAIPRLHLGTLSHLARVRALLHHRERVVDALARLPAPAAASRAAPRSSGRGEPLSRVAPPATLGSVPRLRLSAPSLGCVSRLRLSAASRLRPDGALRRVAVGALDALAHPARERALLRGGGAGARGTVRGGGGEPSPG